MADQVTIYRWDDPGAPQITNASRKPSEIMSLLKACLVDGYGTKQGLGWSIVEENISSATPYISFRNAGSGGVSYFYANNDNTGEFCRVKSFVEYIDKDSNNKGTFEYAFRNLYNYSQTPNYQWILIGTNKAFWFIQTHPAFTTNYWQSAGNGNYIIHCGDFCSIFPSDPCTYTQICGNGAASDRDNNNWTNMLPYTITLGRNTCTNLYALDNTDSNKSYALNSALGTGGFVASSDVAGVDFAPPQINVIADVWLKLGTDASTYYQHAGAPNDPNFPMLRGRVAGLFISDQTGWRIEAFPVIKNINGSDYLQMPEAISGASAVWIKLDEWQ